MQMVKMHVHFMIPHLKFCNKMIEALNTLHHSVRHCVVDPWANFRQETPFIHQGSLKSNVVLFPKYQWQWHWFKRSKIVSHKVYSALFAHTTLSSVTKFILSSRVCAAVIYMHIQLSWKCVEFYLVEQWMNYSSITYIHVGKNFWIYY